MFLEHIWFQKPITSVIFLGETLLATSSGNKVTIYDNKLCKCIYTLYLPTANQIRGLQRISNVQNCQCASGSFYGKNKSHFHFFAAYGNSICCVLMYDPDEQTARIIASPAIKHNVYGCSIIFKESLIRLYVSTTLNNLLVYDVHLGPPCSFMLTTACSIIDASFQYSTAFHFIQCAGTTAFIDFCGTSKGVLVLMPSNGESDPTESKKKIACTSIFGCQKGIIFSIDTLRKSVQNQEDNQGLLVATAAEDRSVVIWENKKVAACELSLDNYKAWCPLWMLAATDPAYDQVLFAARVWCVRLCDWGLVTSGEDCAISLFSWPRDRLEAFGKPLVLRDIHRGRNIWSLVVHFKSETDELLLVSGGGDGAVALTNLRVSCLDSADINAESEPKGQITKLISVGRIKGLPCSESANPRPEKIIAEPEPSFEQKSFVGQDPTTRSISKPLQFSNKPRTVFIGPKGRIYCILESGHLLNTKSSSTDDDPCFNLTLARVLDSRQIFMQHPNLVSSPGAIVEDVYDGQNNLRLDRLFAGYCVIGLNENRSLLALGGRWGTVAVFRFMDSGNLDCLTVFDLPTRNKVMSLSWLNDHPEHCSGSALLVGVFPQQTFIVSLRLDAQSEDSVLGPVFSLVRQSEEEPHSDLAWTSCGTVVQHVEGESEGRVTYILCGSRAGGLYLYKQTESATDLNPIWHQKRCHGRGGVSAVIVLKRALSGNNEEGNKSHPVVVLTSGRLHGCVRRWSFCAATNSLVPLDQSMKPCGLTWVAGFANADSGLQDAGVLALGFSSTDFAAAEVTPPGSTAIVSAGRVHFRVNCAGGNRAWDFAMLPAPAPTFIFCAIQKDSVLVSVSNAQDVRYPQHISAKNERTVTHTTQYLVPPLHGRDINACLLLHNSKSNAADSFEDFTCITGGEDIQLGNLAFRLSPDGLTGATSNGNCCRVEPRAPRFCSGHISNIRCIAPVLNKETAAVASGDGGDGGPSTCRFFVTGGGRGMLALWRLSPDGNTVSPGLLGWVRLDSSVREPGGVTAAAAASNATSISLPTCPIGQRKRARGSCDLRVMCLLGFESGPAQLLLIAGCSDGSLRLFSVTLPSVQTAGCNAQFRQLDDICRSFSSPAVDHPSQSPLLPPPRSCILDAVVLDCEYEESGHSQLHSMRLAYSNTAGLVRACLLPVRDLSAVAELFYLKMTVTGSDSCCSANALACLRRPQSLLAVGGDDGSVRLICWSKARAASVWNCSVRQHYAAVVRVVLVPNSDDSECLLFSLGSDQRLLLWKVNCSNGISLQVSSSLTLAGLGDPHGLSVCCTQMRSTEKPKRYCIVVVGSGVEIVVARPVEDGGEAVERTSIPVLELTD